MSVHSMSPVRRLIGSESKGSVLPFEDFGGGKATAPDLVTIASLSRFRLMTYVSIKPRIHPPSSNIPPLPLRVLFPAFPSRLLFSVMAPDKENSVPQTASQPSAGQKRALNVNPLELGPRKRPYVDMSNSPLLPSSSLFLCLILNH